MKCFLGVDGGGTKTDFLLIDEAGQVLATHRSGSAYYLETGLDELKVMLSAGIKATAARGAVPVSDIAHAFIGVPAYGEDSAVQLHLDRLGDPVLAPDRYRCGNDMVCGWAGALMGRDGINLVAGTGSIAYGEYAGRQARAGGWGELFSDEGSAYWVAREGLNLFSRMSDGRSARGTLYELIRQHFGLRADLDLCGAIYGPPALARSELAGLAPIIAQAARRGDAQARAVFSAAALAMAEMIVAVRESLRVSSGASLAVSYSGGMFRFGELLLAPLRSALAASGKSYEFTAPLTTPAAGAALYAAKLSGEPLSATALAALAGQCPVDPTEDAAP